MFTELHREEKREEGDRGGQEDKGGIKRRETDPASDRFPKCSPQPGTQTDSQICVEKRSGRKETEVARRIKGDSKGERQIQPVISSLSVLHSPEHTKRFTELGREEKGERGDRGGLMDKKESPKWERESSQ